MISRTVSIKGVEKPAHRMFFGTAIPVMLEGGDANALISTAVDAGFNAIDTARGYARAEESVARWLKAAPGNRDRIVLLTKCCDMFGDRTQKIVTAERIRKEIDESLKILGTDHVDVFLLHRDDPTHPVAEYIETLEALRKEGKCLAYGGSNWRHERLAEATDLGYAEADPTADVEGYDAGRKLAIMASIAFHSRVTFDDVYTEGITGITAKDIAYAKTLGWVIKLLAVARNTGDGIEARVHPMLIPQQHPLSTVAGSYNAVFVHGDAVGDVMFYGRGAGEMPTASAVMRPEKA